MKPKPVDPELARALEKNRLASLKRHGRDEESPSVSKTWTCASCGSEQRAARWQALLSSMWHVAMKYLTMKLYVTWLAHPDRYLGLS